jgi:hypothetical protein
MFNNPTGVATTIVMDGVKFQLDIRVKIMPQTRIMAKNWDLHLSKIW